VDAAALETRTIQVGLAPVGAFTDPVQCIGKLLTAPVRAGQALTADAFAADGSFSRLAAALPAGRRAVSISLGDAGSASLLYPGCVVDVLATMRITRASGAQRPVTVTLMQSVSVLAVGSQSIVSGPAPATPAANAATDRPAVVLLVDSRQAEMLKLAMQEGSLSLVLRNPNDTDRALASGADMAALVPMSEPPPVPDREYPAPAMPAPPSDLLEEAATIFEPQQQTWEATVLRGNERESRTFVLPAASKP
jgi:Flp pilus assembly protein CpaB